MSKPRWQRIAADLERRVETYGFDIVHAFPVQLFNAHIPPENQLPTFSRTHSTLAVIIGNTNSLWLPFLHHLAQHIESQSKTDPLDSYVEERINAAVQECCQCIAPPLQGANEQLTCSQAAYDQPSSPCFSACQQLHSIQPQSSKQDCQHHGLQMQYELRFSHHCGPKFVNMLRAAQLSGLAYYSSATHLCMHPVYGSWFALRAVAIFDCEGPDASCYSQLPCPNLELEQQAAAAMNRLKTLGGLDNWQQHWKQWADLRSIGGKFTDPRYCYSPEQLEYHYTKSKSVLAEAVNKLQLQQQLTEKTASISEEQQ